MIRRFVLLMAVLLVPATARAQVVTWTIDPGHTSTQFAVRHMVVATVRGIFDGPTGTVAFDPKDIPGTLKVEAIFNTKSIDTNNAERDADLRSEQFLNVANTGLGSLWVASTLNVNGASAGTLDVSAVDY